MRCKVIWAFAACLLLSGCATTQATGQDDELADMLGPVRSGPELDRAVAEASAHPLGSERNPVRADMPPGQRAYLERLRCSDGNAPAFERGGSVGIGPYGKIMDVYELRCLSGQPATASVYMDMYHSGYVEARPVPGFTIRPPY